MASEHNHQKPHNFVLHLAMLRSAFDVAARSRNAEYLLYEPWNLALTWLTMHLNTLDEVDQLPLFPSHVIPAMSLALDDSPSGGHFGRLDNGRSGRLMEKAAKKALAKKTEAVTKTSKPAPVSNVSSQSDEDELHKIPDFSVIYRSEDHASEQMPCIVEIKPLACDGFDKPARRDFAAVEDQVHRQARGVFCTYPNQKDVLALIVIGEYFMEFLFDRASIDKVLLPDSKASYRPTPAKSSVKGKRKGALWRW